MHPRSVFFLIIAALISAAGLPLFHAQAAGMEVSLTVDASEAPRRILHARETISVHEGPLTLYYPQWIPGEHGPTGPIADFVGLKLSSDGKPIGWRRDLDDMFAFHCAVPAGAATLDLTFDFILPGKLDGFSSGVSSTDQLPLLSWNQVVLYPKEVSPDSITAVARLILPAGWKFGTALENDGESNGEIRFKPLTLTMLIDSPVLTGRFFKQVDIGTVNGVRHYIDMASDGDEALQMPQTMVEQYRKLVRETHALFGARHYNHYDFLYTLSDNTAHFGLEHHQSSDDRVRERTLLDSALRVTAAGLLPHEFVHSWNGKYRRPSGLSTGDYSTPMHGDMLWVYEGLTQYLGEVLTARSGLRTPEQYREHLALTAAALDNEPGRVWRPLQETADAAQILYGSRTDWGSYRRRVDFYDESNLIWLEVDAMIRRGTKGGKSLDDFCRLFHGGQNSGPQLKPYTFEDVVSALNGVLPYNWKTLLTERLQSLNPHAPLGGIELSGWKLVYCDTLTTFMKSYEAIDENIDERFSVGLYIAPDGVAIDAIPGMAATKAGIAPGMKIIAVNGRRFSKEILRAAIGSAKGTTSPIELLVENVGYFKTYPIEYHRGPRYPFLERDASKPDILNGIIKPVTGK